METPHVPASDRLRFKVARRTRWSDEDNQGVLNNALYLTLFEEARHGYFESLGLLEDNRFPFVLAHTNVQFLRPGHGGIDVEIELATTALGTTSFEQAYRVRALATGDVWCEAQARLVCYDPRNGKKQPMTDHFRAAIMQREGAALGSG